MRDVVLAHPQRALQQQRLGHRRVEPAIGGRLAGQRGVGDRRVLQREPERAAVVRVEVADPHAAVRRGLELVLGDLLDVPVAPDRLAQRDAPRVVEAGQQAVGGEDRQAGIAERHEAHQHVAVRALAADLLGVRARGLVAVVAVGDQQLGGRQRLPHRRDRARVADAPEPMRGAVVVGQLAERGVRQLRRERRPGVAVVEREDRGEVRPRRAREPQPVLLRAGVRALVRADPPGAVVLDAHAGEHAVARAAASVRAGVVLLERPQRRLRVGDDDALRRARRAASRRRGRTGRRRRGPAGGRSRRRCRASARAARRAAPRRSRRRAGRRRARARRCGRGRSAARAGARCRPRRRRMLEPPPPPRSDLPPSPSRGSFGYRRTPKSAV